MAIEKDWIIDMRLLKQGKLKLPCAVESASLPKDDRLQYLVPISGIGNMTFVAMLSCFALSDTIDSEDRRLIKMLAQHLSVYLNLQSTHELLLEHQQFAAFNQMSTFLIHDLKNVQAQLSLIDKNSQKHRHNEEFIDDTFVTVNSAATRLGKVISHLVKHKLEPHSKQRVLLAEVVENALKERLPFTPSPVLITPFSDAPVIFSDQEKLTNIITNLIKNAQDACKVKGKVWLSHHYEQEMLVISIEDDGEGMSAEFIAKRLFKPFDTTKGNAGLGVGAYDAKKFIEQLQGYISVHSVEGQGSRFDLHLPVQRTQNQSAAAVMANTA